MKKVKSVVSIPEDRNIPLNSPQAALYTNMSEAFFARARWAGFPSIPYIKLPGLRGAVLYRRDDLDAFFNGLIVTSTSQSGERRVN